MEKISKILKEKRLEKGLTIEDVSKLTRLTQKHIKAIEEGNMEFFHDDLSYLRFFVKSYCEAVDLDFEDLKDDLRTSVSDYTETMALNIQMSHEEMEKSIAHSDKLSKVRDDNAENVKVRKHNRGQKSHLNKRDLKHVDLSLVSLIAIVGVVVIILASALVLFMNSNESEGTAKKKNEQPVADKQKDSGDNTKPSTKKKTEKETNKEISVTQSDATHYTIDNVNDNDEVTFEIFTGANPSDFKIMTLFDGQTNDVENAPKGIQQNGTTINTLIKAKKGMKVQIYFGCMSNISLKVNNKNVKVDDTINRVNQSACKETTTLEFTITGEE